MTVFAVVDSTCLIVLERIDKLSLLRESYPAIIVPPEVSEEFGCQLDWIEVRPIGDPRIFNSLSVQLGPGESAAIALAVELRPAAIVLDDLEARRHAAKLELPVIGTVGLILKAKAAGLLSEVRPMLDELTGAGFYLSESVRNEALHIAGER